MAFPLRSWVLALTLAGAALVAGVAGAAVRSWNDYAPSPLASDSSYAALSAPGASVDADQRRWLRLQRRWREERRLEATQVNDPGAITESPFRHSPDDSDGRYAELMSRAYESLSPTERSELFTIASQRSARSTVRNYAVGALVVVVAGAIAVAGMMASQQESYL